MCTNRLVQHGLQVRLQLFKTQNKGWGIRCLDDIAKGSFVCIYAGNTLIKDLDFSLFKRTITPVFSLCISFSLLLFYINICGNTLF